MSELEKAAEVVLKAMQKVCQGCQDVKDDSGPHKEAKTLAGLVRRDLILPMQQLEDALENLKENSND